MPPRRVCLTIVLFWLSFNGYLLYHDLLPRLLPGQPPPYNVDLVEEAQTRRPHIDWTVYLDKDPVFRARTSVTNPDHDVFELTSEFTPLTNAPPPPLHGIILRKMASRYRVNSAGDLLGLTAEIEGTPQFAQALRIIAADFTARVDGSVANGEFTPHLTLEVAGLKRDKTLPTVRIPAGGSILLPLHPVNRLRDLQPGQRWTMRVFDPLADSLSALQGQGAELRLLRVRVAEAPEPLTWGRRRDVDCLAVHYEGDDFTATTLVGKERGQVLSQEVRFDNQRWIMYRD